MMTMQDWKDLDACITPMRGNKILQQTQMWHEWANALEPVSSALNRFMSEFGWTNATSFNVIFDDLFNQLAFLAAGGTVSTVRGSYCYSSGHTYAGSTVNITLGGQVLKGYGSSFNSNLGYPTEQVVEKPTQCVHEPVLMVFSSFCKKCNATLK